ncbi:Transmembrane protein 135 [Lamellibrachia satsuma]|nr:Transmembrane protein 135 [Lamellibrachia satsuma]
MFWGNPHYTIPVSTFGRRPLSSFRSRKGLNPSVRSAIVFIVGPSELPPGESTGTKVQHSRPDDSPGSRESDMCLASGTFIPPEGAAVYKRFLPSDVWPILEMKHSLCRHQGGCVYTLIKSSVRCLCGGFALQAAVKVVSSISSILRRPRALRHALLHQHNLQLGAFLASFTALFQGMSCLLRHLLGQENATHGLLAGLLAGTSMFLYKSSTVALYMTSKLTEILYMKGIEAGLLPYVQSADILLYAVSMSLIIHVAILEPHNLRPTYWKFLLKLTHGQ